MRFPSDEREKVIAYLMAVREITPQHPYFSGVNAPALPLCQAALDLAISGQEDTLNGRQCTCLIRVLRGEHDIRGYLRQEMRQVDFPQTIAWLDRKRSSQPPRGTEPLQVHPAVTTERSKPPYFVS